MGKVVNAVNIYLNKNIDPNSPISSILIVDDDLNICEILAQTTILSIKNIFLVCSISPISALKLSKLIPFDVIVCDICMKEMMGDKVISEVRASTPLAHIIAMTGVDMAAAFLAGTTKPDDFYEKYKGPSIYMEKIKLGIAKSIMNKQSYLPGQYDAEKDIFMAKEFNWYKRGQIRKAIGMSIREYSILKMRIKAWVLMQLGKISEPEIVKYTKYSSLQMMRKSLERFSFLPDSFIV